MTARDRGEWGSASRAARADGRLAPVSYLPWVSPEAKPAAPAVPTRAVPGEGGGDGSPLVGEALTPAEQAAIAAASLALLGDRVGLPETGVAESETTEVALAESGTERDDRLDRLIVGKLGRAQLSVAEVRAVLVEHGLDDAEVEEWIERYERLGYLDDGRLAEQLVHLQHGRRGKGSGAILHELTRRGIDQTMARAAVAEIDEESETAAAIEIAARRVRQLRGLDRMTVERRLSAFLQRRGYRGDLVRRAVETAMAGGVELDS